MLDGEKGSQDFCNRDGKLWKPFEPKLTGQFNYDKRLLATQKLKGNFAPIELPRSLEPSFNKIYSPQNNLLEGYT
jgi:hypothetical protein